MRSSYIVFFALTRLCSIVGSLVGGRLRLVVFNRGCELMVFSFVDATSFAKRRNAHLSIFDHCRRTKNFYDIERAFWKSIVIDGGLYYLGDQWRCVRLARDGGRAFFMMANVLKRSLPPLRSKTAFGRNEEERLTVFFINIDLVSHEAEERLQRLAGMLG